MITESTRADIEAGVGDLLRPRLGRRRPRLRRRSTPTPAPPTRRSRSWRRARACDLDGDPWIVDKETQPPSRISQGKLIEMMEERGLGTKATRADIIQKLFDRGYVYGNPPVPSETGIALYEAFKNYVPAMATPEMTAELEAEMDQIAAGEMTKGAVVGESRDLLHKTWTEIDGSREDLAKVDLERDGRGPHPRPLQGLRRSRPQEGGRLAQHAADHPREKIGQTLRRLQRLDPRRSRTPATRPSRCPSAATSSSSRSAARSASRTPRLKVVALPRPALEPLPQRRLRVDAGDEETPGRARSRQSGESGDGEEAAGRKATRTLPDKAKKAKVKASKADTATRGRKRAKAGGQRLRPAALFISLEGVDGSGKSTQARLLVEALGAETVAIREPGGTDAAERIRELLADPAVELEPLAELMLFLAARADLTERVIRPALEAGRDVVADRFSDSSVAYQGAARGLGVGEVIGLCDTATDGLWPDLTLLLKIDPETRPRPRRRRGPLRAEGLELQRAVAEAYEEIAMIASRPGRRDRRRRHRRGGPRAGDGGRASVPMTTPVGQSSAARGDRAPGAGAGGAERGAGGEPLARLPLPRAPRLRQAGRGARLRGRDPRRRRRGPRGRAAPRPARPLAAPRPRLARAARRPAPGRGGARAGDPRRRLPALRRRQAGLRRRGGRGDARREPERAAEDARGAARVRPPDPAQLRAARACWRRSPRAASRSTSRRCRPRCSKPSSAAAVEAADGRRRTRSRPRPGSPPATSSGPACCSATRGRELRAEAERCVAAALEGEVRGGALEGAARPRPGRRRGGRSGGPRGARGGSEGRDQAQRQRDRRRAPNAPAAAAAPRSSTSASSSAPPGCATSPPSPPAPRRSSSTATASSRCAPRPAGLDPAARPPRRRAGPGDPPRPRPQRLRGAGPRGALLPARDALLAG